MYTTLVQQFLIWKRYYNYYSKASYLFIYLNKILLFGLQVCL